MPKRKLSHFSSKRVLAKRRKKQKSKICATDPLLNLQPTVSLTNIDPHSIEPVISNTKDSCLQPLSSRSIYVTTQMEPVTNLRTFGCHQLRVNLTKLNVDSYHQSNIIFLQPKVNLTRLNINLYMHPAATGTTATSQLNYHYQPKVHVNRIDVNEFLEKEETAHENISEMENVNPMNVPDDFGIIRSNEAVGDRKTSPYGEMFNRKSFVKLY